MRKRVLAQLLVVVLLAVAAVAGCGDGQEGALPVLKTGDEWVYGSASAGFDYAETWEVTGEDVVDGSECWVVKMSYEPPFQGMETATVRVEKATYFPIKGQTAMTVMGIPITLVQEYSCQFPDGSPWPLEVGKEFDVVVTTTTTTTSLGDPETESETTTKTYKVEKVEEVTVAAGTFKCFKMVEYDEAGAKVSTAWHSDRVKQDVKSVDHETGDTKELESYSV
jgi:hypothetical protein